MVSFDLLQKPVIVDEKILMEVSGYFRVDGLLIKFTGLAKRIASSLKADDPDGDDSDSRYQVAISLYSAFRFSVEGGSDLLLSPDEDPNNECEIVISETQIRLMGITLGKNGLTMDTIRRSGEKRYTLDESFPTGQFLRLLVMNPAQWLRRYDFPLEVI